MHGAVESGPKRIGLRNVQIATYVVGVVGVTCSFRLGVSRIRSSTLKKSFQPEIFPSRDLE